MDVGVTALAQRVGQRLDVAQHAAVQALGEARGRRSRARRAGGAWPRACRGRARCRSCRARCRCGRPAPRGAHGDDLRRGVPRRTRLALIGDVAGLGPRLGRARAVHHLQDDAFAQSAAGDLQRPPIRGPRRRASGCRPAAAGPLRVELVQAATSATVAPASTRARARAPGVEQRADQAAATGGAADRDGAAGRGDPRRLEGLHRRARTRDESRAAGGSASAGGVGQLPEPTGREPDQVTPPARVPTASSLDPPPTSTTATVPVPARAAPASRRTKASRASSPSVRTSTSTPARSRTAATRSRGWRPRGWRRSTADARARARRLGAARLRRHDPATSSSVAAAIRPASGRGRCG